MAKVIKAEHLSKAYQLGDFGTGTISRDLERFWARVRGKEDPFLRIGETNDRTTKGESDIVWSLKDLNFEVEQGDAVGVIGRNGAGKSTLLKILSRVTSPTTGSVKIKGRIASLLEVGTGFHPELTGRENIFLNGAILGMRKAEIKRKFDEIVDFAGVERYIDTPVKRYSSGMYVRLAFAVAAHLESEILIIDEVLAVGDAEFQKKCLGKMGDVSKGEGRTVLFVSHNMTSIISLCNNCILLANGEIQMIGKTAQVVESYVKNNLNLGAVKDWLQAGKRPGNEIVQLLSVRAVDKGKAPNSTFDITEPIGVEIEYEVLQEGHTLWHGINFFTEDGINIFDSHSVTSKWYSVPHPKGIYKTIAWLPGNLFNEGKIIINVAIFNHTQHRIHLHEKDVIAFEIADFLREDNLSSRGESVGRFPGSLRPLLQWE
ncbi:MAG TPA: ABC transporter ATP-binding protein [Mucilaginibacter sp.]|nr:ABC transporter ATP-binding protein [Mucilaginibacter sp.]